MRWHVSGSFTARMTQISTECCCKVPQKKFDHVSPILKSLHWLPVHFRIEFKILVFVFKSIHNLAPTYLSDLLCPHNPTRNLRSGDQGLLSAPWARLKKRGDRSFAVARPRLWNSPPIYIRTAQSLNVFKSSLKTHFFSLAFNSMWSLAMELPFISVFLFIVYIAQPLGQPWLLFWCCIFYLVYCSALW